MGEQWRVAVRWAVVGHGGHVVRRTSAWWEALVAAREHRRPMPLYHGALELTRDGETSVLELTPSWGRRTHDGRDVVAVGAVAASWLGRSPLFRYEIRCTAAGLGQESAGVVVDVVGRGRAPVDAVSAAVLRVPPLTWGRRIRPAGEMWTSNSVVSWVLADAGLVGDRRPPAGGRAPGWDAGIALAVSSPR